MNRPPGPASKRSGVAFLGTLMVLSAALPAAAAPQSGVVLHIDTDLGSITAEVDTVLAPITATNFLKYVDLGLYSGGTFYRTVRLDNQPDDTVKIEVIQGGIARDRRDDQLPPIPLESTRETGILHLDGVLSMARAGPETARGEFFICIGPQPELDEGGHRQPDGRGFAAFGRVIDGMEVVHRIHARNAEGQYFSPDTRVRIQRIRRGG